MFQPLCLDFMVGLKSSTLASTWTPTQTRKLSFTDEAFVALPRYRSFDDNFSAASVLPKLSRYGATGAFTPHPLGSNAPTPALSVLPDFTLITDVDARKQQFLTFLKHTSTRRISVFFSVESRWRCFRKSWPMGTD